MNVAAAAATPAIHPPQVAGQFYPADPAALRARLAAAYAAAPAPRFRAKMIVCPHAGIDYCASVAVRAVGALDNPAGLKRLIVLGPNHRVPLRGVAIHPAAVWATPLGSLPVAQAALASLLSLEGVRVDPAPFAGEHSLEVPLVFLQSRFPHLEIAPVLVGEASPELVEAILTRLWGGPETAICISSDLSHFLDRDAARAKDAATRARVETGNWGAIGPTEACGYSSLRGAMRRAADLRMRTTGLAMSTSDDAGGPRDRVVGYGAFAFEYPGVAVLTAEERQTLIGLASVCLEHAVAHGGQVPALVAGGAAPPALLAHRAAFVTLERGGALRGCIGSLAPQRPLAGDVGINAVKAGFADPRFPALKAEELPGMAIKISVLSPASRIVCASEAELLADLRPDRDGLILRDGAASAVFLPSVWRELPDVRMFVRQLKRKMGVSPDHWSETMQAFRFEAESFGSEWRAAAGERPAPTSIWIQA